MESFSVLRRQRTACSLASWKCLPLEALCQSFRYSAEQSLGFVSTLVVFWKLGHLRVSWTFKFFCRIWQISKILKPKKYLKVSYPNQVPGQKQTSTTTNCFQSNPSCEPPQKLACSRFRQYDPTVGGACILGSVSSVGLGHLGSPISGSWYHVSPHNQNGVKLGSRLQLASYSRFCGFLD